MSDNTSPPIVAGIVDVVKGSVVSAALFLAFIYLPLFGMLPGIFAPAPAIYFHVKSGRKVGLGIVAATAALLASGDPMASLIYLLQAGVIALVLPDLLLRGKGGTRSIVYAVAANLVCMVAAAATYGYFTGANLQAKVVKGVQASITQTVALYSKTGISADELKTVQESMQQAGSLIVTTYPAMVTIALGFIAALNLLLVSRFAAKFHRPLQLGDFSQYRNPEPMVWLLIVAGFTMLAPQGLAYYAALNVLLVLGTLYGVQGWAIVSHFFSRFAVPRYVRIIFGVMMLQPFMLLAIAALGIFDLWGDFRTPKNKENL